jgi:hypothetical protein
MEQDETVIYSLKEYIDWVEKNYKRKAYYRGHADINWHLIPSVFRNPYKGLISEHLFLKQASSQAWCELLKYHSYLEKLIFLQHYGLPTRLLDVTFNPLVALYMACCSNDDKDGVVYVGYRYEQDNYNIAEKTIEYVFSYNHIMAKDDLDKFARSHKLPLEDFCKPLFLFPPLNNSRIERQQGAFIMAPYAKNNDGIPFDTNDSFDSTNFFEKSKAVIPNSKKEKLLRHLSILGMNEASFYQSISNKLSYIIQEEKWRIKDEDAIELE